MPGADTRPPTRGQSGSGQRSGWWWCLPGLCADRTVAKPRWPVPGAALRGSPWGGAPSQELSLWPWFLSPPSVRDAHREAVSAHHPAQSVPRRPRRWLRLGRPSRLWELVASGGPGLHRHRSTQGGLAVWTPCPHPHSQVTRGPGGWCGQRAQGCVSGTALLYTSEAGAEHRVGVPSAWPAGSGRNRLPDISWGPGLRGAQPG